MRNSVDIRVIRKVRKTQNQNPELGHKQGEVQKKTCKNKYISIQRGDETQKTINFGGKLSFILSFFPFSRAPPLLLHIFSLLLTVHKYYIISLELCALNAEVSAFHTELFTVYNLTSVWDQRVH
jgi:hypothetical protein